MLKALLVTTMMAGPAAAMAPPWLVCQNADGTSSEFMTVWDEDTALAGVTSFEVRGLGFGAPVPRVFVDCKTGKAVSYVEAESAEADSRVWEAIEARKSLTMRQLHRVIRDLGYDTKYGRIEPGNCACNPTTHRNSF